MPPLTVGDVLADARARLASVTESPGLDAQLLLVEVLGVERPYLLAHPERPLDETQTAQIEAMIARRAAGEPLAYIRGWAHFYDRTFQVSPAVLIPRPETELLLEKALAHSETNPPRAVVDVGTGSGILAVTYAAHRPGVPVYATDISPAALRIAQANAAAQGVEVIFFEGDLLQPLVDRGITVDLLLSNPPYIASAVVPRLEVSRHEPLLALDGGPDGLELIRRLLVQARKVCAPDAVMMLEIGYDQGEALPALARELLGEGIRVTVDKDLAGHDRIVTIERTP